MIQTPGPTIQAAEAALEDVAAFIERGTPAFLRTNLALFAAGFAPFELIYCVQPLMPVFSARSRCWSPARPPRPGAASR